MPLRSFTAPDGRVWQVWQVIPASLPGQYPRQRVRDRRSPEPVLLYAGPERRVAERRRDPPRNTAVLSGFDSGWLVFESDGEKRRLAPAPADWDTCPDEVLAGYLARATAAPWRESRAN
jgi:hypothetical protein